MLPQSEMVEKKSDSSINSSLQIFLAGHLFDPHWNLSDIPKDIIQVISNITTYRFIYEYSFDQKGVLSCLRNLAGTTIDKMNIIGLAKSNTVISTPCTTVYVEDFMKKKPGIPSIEILGKPVIGTFISYGGVLQNNDYETFLFIDLQKFKLCVTHMTYCCNLEVSDMDVKEMNIYGSNDEKSWKLLFGQPGKRRDKSLDIKVMKLRNWDYPNSKNLNDYYRFFKITPSNSNHFGYVISKMAISGIELYGHLI
jgi:hypothetical protein